jgi:hypothetical protein
LDNTADDDDSHARARCLTTDPDTGDRCTEPATHRKRCQRHYRAVMRRNPAVQLADRDRKLQARYGITVDEADALMTARDWCCEICGRGAEAFVRGLCIDHDHRTGRVRGILCPLCNAGIGHLSENPAVLAAARAYLDRAI